MNLEITRWKELSLKLKHIKAEEAELRREICEVLIADNEMTNGSVTVKDHIEGFDVKAVQKLGYTVDVAALGTIWNDLSELEQACITMKPTLTLAPYRKLPEDSLLHEAIVSRLSMPTLQADPYEE